MLRFALLVGLALYELLVYEVVIASTGFRRVRYALASLPVRPSRHGFSPEDLARISAAMNWAVILYWKHVHCLQRSISMARLLRRNGIAGRLIIGFREMPFLCHAWVEVEGKVIGDSQKYQESLQVLDIIEVPGPSAADTGQRTFFGRRQQKQSQQ